MTSNLAQITIHDHLTRERLEDLLLQGEGRIIVFLSHRLGPHDLLFHRLNELKAKVIYLKYRPDQRWQERGFSPSQISWARVRWSFWFPQMKFELLTDAAVSSRWTPPIKTNWIFRLVAVLYLTELSIRKPLRDFLVRARNRTMSAWRSFSFIERWNCFKAGFHEITKPLKKIFYFLRYLALKLTKRSR